MSVRRTSMLLATSALAGVLTGVLTGCGSSDSPGSPDPAPTSASTAPASSRAAFLQAGNEVCEALKATLTRISGDVGTLDPQEQETFVVEQLLPAFQTAVDALRAIPAPADDVPTVSRLLDRLQARIDAARADPTSFVSGPDDSAALDHALDAYGLTSCGSGLG